MSALTISYSALRRAGAVVLEAGNIELPAGRGIGVIGLNGAGKTTFLMAAAGVLRGADLTLNGVPAFDGAVAYMPQNSPLPAWLSVRDVFALYGTSLPAAAAAYPGLRLDEIDGRKVGRLTPGQKQALAAAVTLMSAKDGMRPARWPADVFVLDEPFAGLDFHRQRALRTALAAAAADRTVIVSAQSITDLLEFCDRFIILRSGRIVFASRLDELGLPAAGPAEFEKAVLDLILDSRLETSG